MNKKTDSNMWVMIILFIIILAAAIIAKREQEIKQESATQTIEGQH